MVTATGKDFFRFLNGRGIMFGLDVEVTSINVNGEERNPDANAGDLDDIKDTDTIEFDGDVYAGRDRVGDVDGYYERWESQINKHKKKGVKTTMNILTRAADSAPEIDVAEFLDFVHQRLLKKRYE